LLFDAVSSVFGLKLNLGVQKSDFFSSKYGWVGLGIGNAA
jgi:hypothetical protein